VCVFVHWCGGGVGLMNYYEHYNMCVWESVSQLYIVLFILQR
jgi:hypothetical protein